MRIINDFLYTTHDGIGFIEVLGQTFDYFSEFHKFWHEHYSEILDCKIDDDACESVADALHNIYVITEGKAFSEIWVENPERTDPVRQVLIDPLKLF